MNSPEKTIRILGILLLIGFATTVATVYWDLPARLRSSASGEASAPKPTQAPPSLPATPTGQCPVYHGPGSDASMTAGTPAETGGGCCAKKPAAATHECGMESAACEHGKVTGDSPAPSARASAAPVQPANQPEKQTHAH